MIVLIICFDFCHCRSFNSEMVPHTEDSILEAGGGPTQEEIPEEVRGGHVTARGPHPARWPARVRLIINYNIMKINSNLFKIKASVSLHGVNTFLTVLLLF